jgi:glycogen operon protein
VQLLVFGRDDSGKPLLAHALDPLVNKSGRVWHCAVHAAELAGAAHYAYVVNGPQPESGPAAFDIHAFHGEKLLLDPYARSIHFPPGFSRSAALDGAPNLGRAPLAVLAGRGSRDTWRKEPPPHHEADAIIYELHVRNFTIDASAGIAQSARGSFAGVVEKIPYLRDLGVTIVELMPVFQYDPQGTDRWGYMPMSFFAPHASYAPVGRDAVDAFREMVDALHAADIEVVLDVVYNHTAEGGAGGPIYNFKGLDNSTYYLMTPNGNYADFSGCGNSLNANNRYVRKMILDSMRYWVHEMRVDGFRFDLASVFSRNPDGALNFDDPPLFGDITSHPTFDRTRLIAEPWDAGGAYELGKAYPGTTWMQWNSRFRDDLRRFVRGDAGMVGTVMQRLYGSDDLFPDGPLDAYHPYQSVNYVTCHDGLTLFDLVGYDRKHNDANGHGNTDGPVESFSWNCGWEGEEGASADVGALRERQAKNFIALLLLANGTPMLRAGDEFLATQRGNDNPYNQDNATSWLDWTRLSRYRDFHRFVREMIAFRKAHPSLARSRFWREDVRWFGTIGSVDLGGEARAFALCLRGASQKDDDIYVMVNAAASDADFVIQDLDGGSWRRAIDTSLAPPDDIDGKALVALSNWTYRVASRSVVVLVRAR